MQFDRVTRGKVLGTGRQICTSHVQPPSKNSSIPRTFPMPSVSTARCQRLGAARAPNHVIIASQSTNLCTLVYAISTIHRLRRLEFATESKNGPAPKSKRTIQLVRDRKGPAPNSGWYPNADIRNLKLGQTKSPPGILDLRGAPPLTSV